MTACAPGAHVVRMRVSSAARPEAKASARAPVMPGASRATRHSSNAVRVGLPDREYS